MLVVKQKLSLSVFLLEIPFKESSEQWREKNTLHKLYMLISIIHSPYKWMNEKK